MRSSTSAALTWALFATAAFFLLPVCVCGKVKDRDWRTGVLLSSSQARHFVMMLHNSDTNTTGSADISGQVSPYGSVDATATSRSSSSTNGYSMPIYRVYETYVVKGRTMYYIARERLRWRWSKPADAAIGEQVRYAVKGRKLFLLDDKGHEHQATIAQRVLVSEVERAMRERESPTGPSGQEPAKVTVRSSPTGADISVDGKYVGSTPSTLRLTPGDHVFSVGQPGFKPWQRTVSVSGGSEITVEATLQK